MRAIDRQWPPARSASGGSRWMRRDARARALATMVRLRARVPGWQAETLGVLASAEAEGVRLLEEAYPSITHAGLRRTFCRHIEDEKRHAAGFAGFYRSLTGKEPARPRAAESPSRTLFEFFAFLESTELRGLQAMENYYPLFADHPSIQAFIEQVSKDERFHASYVHQQLERLSRDGHAEEVGAARRSAARSDALGFWLQVAGFLRSLPRILMAAATR